MNYFIEDDGNTHYSLCENNRDRSILQNVMLLISTRKGTVPMYRDFGIPMDYLDKPATIAATIAAKEINDALDKFEPRAKLKNIYFKSDKSGKMTLEVEI